MKIYIRFMNGDYGEYEATQSDIDRGFECGRFKLTRYGTVEYIPVGAVHSISLPESAPSTVDRGFARK